MYTPEQLEKDFVEQRVIYFKKYFYNKHIKSGLLDAFEENLKTLTKAYIQFMLLYDCLKIICDTKEFKLFYDKNIQAKINKTKKR